MGPLAGFRIVEFAGIGPAPMAAMLFADLGASVIRLDRVEPSGLGVDIPARFGLLARSRPSVAVDIKHPEGLALATDLIGKADGLIEGFRPGTMERLGLGPEVALKRNPRLVYGRMTGWGQSGPLAQAAGHDLNYLALTGALAAIGRAGAKPTPPLNLAADFGGGALYLAFGMACAMLEAQRSGKGQVVDAAMTEGAASLMTIFYGLHAAGLHSLERGTNLLDSGSAIYDTYECADGRYIAIAPIELKFRKVLFERLGLPYTKDDGPSCAVNSKLCSRRAAGINGVRCSREPTPASRRSSPWKRRRIIRTTSPAAPSSSSTAWCSRGRRRALGARPPVARRRRERAGKARGRRLPIGASLPRRSTHCSPRACSAKLKWKIPIRRSSVTRSRQARPGGW